MSINERRIKFKPALFKQQRYIHSDSYKDKKKYSLKEFWFAGVYEDVGKGWLCGDGEVMLSTLL